jgi:dolichyl-diphosphooligosaccharide--protein glycosyltransferase
MYFSCFDYALFLFFALALKNGSILISVFAAISYGYLSLTWGGYVFISNCIPLFVVARIFLGGFSYRIYIVYSIWGLLGTLFTSQIPFIFEKTLSKPEHLMILAVFFLVQLWGLFSFLIQLLSHSSYNTVVVSSIMLLPIVLIGAITIAISTGILGSFSGRLIQMFDPTYAAKNIPIIASVAEHQPTSWSKFLSDSSILIILFLPGCFYLLSNLTETNLLLLIYGLSTMYFATIMVRLVLVFTPAMALIAAVGFHFIMKKFISAKFEIHLTSILVSFFIIVMYSLLSSVFFSHYYWSGDHIHNTVLSPTGRDQSDDYREAYCWLWDNTNPYDIVESWWDYGYQITSLANRPCLADGNTNNFTHIGIIGMTMSSPEEVSWHLARMMDVKYMLVVFGGASGYSGDDMNKFLWMPRIANQTFFNISGSMYQPKPNLPAVGSTMTANMSNSLIFKMAYTQFHRFVLYPQYGKNFDYTRQIKIDPVQFNLRYFEEAFTSKYWIIRLFRVRNDPIWDKAYQNHPHFLFNCWLFQIKIRFNVQQDPNRCQ